MPRPRAALGGRVRGGSNMVRLAFPPETSVCFFVFFFSSRRRHTRSDRDWSSDVCSSDLEFLRSFYGDFKVTMEKAEAEMDRVQKPLEEIDELCPQCGRKLVIRTGRFGRFISCSGFPECNYRRSFVNKTGALCPLCGGDLVERKTKQKNRVFYGCSNYPTCNFAIWDKPVPDLCPNCGGLMVIPKSGKVAVCYAEVIAVQRSPEERPQQDGSGKTTRPARAASSSVRTATRTTRRTT